MNFYIKHFFKCLLFEIFRWFGDFLYTLYIDTELSTKYQQKYQLKYIYQYISDICKRILCIYKKKINIKVLSLHIIHCH